MPTETSTDDVSSAMTLLRDSLTEEEQRIRAEGAAVMQGGDHNTAASVIEFAKRLLIFQKKVEALVTEWEELEDLRDTASPAVQEIVSKRFFGKKKKGEITPHQEFCQAILEVLVEMGGSGKTKAVLNRVGIKIPGILKPTDYEPHQSGEKQIRWRNSAVGPEHHGQRRQPDDQKSHRNLGNLSNRPKVAPPVNWLFSHLRKEGDTNPNGCGKWRFRMNLFLGGHS